MWTPVELAHDRRQRSAGLREQVEQLDEGGGGVEGGQEVGPDEPALERGREVDVAARRHLHQVGGGELRPDDLGAVLGRDALGLPAHRHRQRDAGTGVRRRDQRHQREQRLLGPEHDAFVVDERRRLAVGVDDHAEVAPRRPDELGDARRAAHFGSSNAAVADGRARERVDRQHLGTDLGEHASA